MNCPECEKGTVRLKLSNNKAFGGGFFSKSLSGFQTVTCPKCNGTGTAYLADTEYVEENFSF